MNIDILLLVKCADIPNKLIGLIVAKLKRIGRIVFQLGWNIHIQAVTRTTLCDNNFYKTKNPHGSQQQQQQKSYRNTDWSEFNAKISGNTASTGFRIAHTQKKITEKLVQVSYSIIFFSVLTLYSLREIEIATQQLHHVFQFRFATNNNNNLQIKLRTQKKFPSRFPKAKKPLRIQSDFHFTECGFLFHFAEVNLIYFLS